VTRDYTDISSHAVSIDGDNRTPRKGDVVSEPVVENEASPYVATTLSANDTADAISDSSTDRNSSNSSISIGISNMTSGNNNKIPHQYSTSSKTKPQAGFTVTSTIHDSISSAGDAELRKALRKKNQEIEKLNAECLELEDQCSALKTEVREAWDNYKIAQERSVARETELLDEIKQLQKAKLVDKQQMLGHVSKVQGDVDEMVKQLKTLEDERDGLLQRLEEVDALEAAWQTKEAELMEELEEARASSVQGVHSLREELRAAVVSSEQLRTDQASLMRSSQMRQAELEAINSELSSSLTEKQRELSRLQQQLQQTGRDDFSFREMDGLRQQNVLLGQQVEEERDKVLLCERKLRQMECEIRAAQISLDDERVRAASINTDLSNQIAVLEDKLRDTKGVCGSARSQLKREQGEDLGHYRSPSSIVRLGRGAISGDDLGILTPQKGENILNLSPEATSAKFEKMEEEIQGLAQNVQNLSKQLLAKQTHVLELQAERSALKSRVADLQARCCKAEQQLATLRDLEDDDFSAVLDDNDDAEIGGLGGGGGNFYESNGAGGGLKQRGGGRNSSVLAPRRRPPGSHKMISDLEKLGVKPAPAVAKAVNYIDAWTLLTGRFLKSYPMLRFGFVLYLLFLHLWVFIVLGYQTHSLEELELDKRPHDRMNP